MTTPVVDFGHGHHTWPFWQHALHASFDLLTEAVGARAAPDQANVTDCFGY